MAGSCVDGRRVPGTPFACYCPVESTTIARNARSRFGNGLSAPDEVGTRGYRTVTGSKESFERDARSG